jgi:hypothetical protein
MRSKSIAWQPSAGSSVDLHRHFWEGSMQPQHMACSVVHQAR